MPPRLTDDQNLSLENQYRRNKLLKMLVLAPTHPEDCFTVVGEERFIGGEP